MTDGHGVGGERDAAQPPPGWWHRAKSNKKLEATREGARADAI